MQPTLLIGLDGATFTVLDPLLADGHMPHLQAFLNGGVRAELLSTPHPLTPPAWTTALTGRGPGGHGVFDFLRTEVRGDRAFSTLTNFRDIRCETLWTLLSRWGGRVLSLNFPLMAPPPDVNGVIVPGLLSWRHLRRNIYPPELYDDLKALPGFNLKEFSFDIEDMTAAAVMKEEELLPWIQTQVLAKDRHWFGIHQHLTRTESYDLTGVMFDGVDKIQHVCWRYLDPKFLPAQPSAVERTFRNVCLEYFRQLDGFLGQIFAAAGEGVNIFIASDHGFGPSVRSFRVNKWLEQQGHLKWPDSPPGSGPRKNSHFVHLDWAHTTVYAPSAPTNGVYIRVQQGADAPGVPPTEYHAFRARLIEQLRALRDPFTGEPFLKNILVREEAFPGAYQDKAPDLTLVPFDHGLVSVLNAEPLFVERPVTGTHYPVGILLARGPAVAKGPRVPRQSILDLAPTLLHSLGLPIPEDMEGRPMEAVFDEGFWRSHPVKVGPATEPPQSGGPRRADPAADAAEEQGILTRLRDLGYVE